MRKELYSDYHKQMQSLGHRISTILVNAAERLEHEDHMAGSLADGNSELLGRILSEHTDFLEERLGAMAKENVKPFISSRRVLESLLVRRSTEMQVASEKVVQKW